MAGQDQSPVRSNPIGEMLSRLFAIATGLFLAEMIAPFGVTPGLLMRAWFPDASNQFFGYAPGGNAWWRLAGWCLIVLVILDWRVFVAGGIATLRVLTILFVAAALAYAFKGDTTLWRF